MTHNEESNDRTGIVRYFYIHNTKTGEISGKLREEVLIDKTAPGQEWSSSENKAVDKSDDHIPYFHIEANAWRKFLNELTFELYFNDMMKIVVENADDEMKGEGEGAYFGGDNQSHIWDKKFVICPKKCNTSDEIEAGDCVSRW